MSQVYYRSESEIMLRWYSVRNRSSGEYVKREEG